MNESDKSWVARWQRIAGRKYRPGLYAISVSGAPPNEEIAEAERKGFRYINRSQH